jgi:hypothetical protein
VSYPEQRKSWTQRFLSSLRAEEPTFREGNGGGISENFDVAVRWDDTTDEARALVDLRTPVPSPVKRKAVELRFDSHEDPRQAAAAVVLVGKKRAFGF